MGVDEPAFDEPIFTGPGFAVDGLGIVEGLGIEEGLGIRTLFAAAFFVSFVSVVFPFAAIEPDDGTRGATEVILTAVTGVVLCRLGDEGPS